MLVRSWRTSATDSSASLKAKACSDLQPKNFCLLPDTDQTTSSMLNLSELFVTSGFGEWCTCRNMTKRKRRKQQTCGISRYRQQRQFLQSLMNRCCISMRGHHCAGPPVRWLRPNTAPKAFSHPLVRAPCKTPVRERPPLWKGNLEELVCLAQAACELLPAQLCSLDMHCSICSG